MKTMHLCNIQNIFATNGTFHFKIQNKHLLLQYYQHLHEYRVFTTQIGKLHKEKNHNAYVVERDFHMIAISVSI